MGCSEGRGRRSEKLLNSDRALKVRSNPQWHTGRKSSHVEENYVSTQTTDPTRAYVMTNAAANVTFGKYAVKGWMCKAF